MITLSVENGSPARRLAETSLRLLAAEEATAHSAGEISERDALLARMSLGAASASDASVDLEVEADDILHFVTWGGGGWGDPLERDPALVGKEIVQGLVTAKGARAYGVVAAENGAVDEDATTALRKDMRTARGAIEVFDFGPDLDTLRATCEAETGLPAPRPPRWQHALQEAAE